MSRLLSMICSAAGILAVSSNVIAQTTTATSAKRTAFFEQGLPLVDSTEGKYKADPAPYTGYYAPDYAAPAAAHVDNTTDVNVNASFIYWYFSQDAMDIAYVPPNASATAASPPSFVDQDFKYKPGFKIGLGYDTRFDNWSLNADYTWFHAKSSTNETHSTPDLLGNTFFPHAYFDISFVGNHVHSDWKMHMDMVDLVAGRPFYQSTNITIAPTGGLRALFLRQTINITLATTTPSTLGPISNNSSHSWAIGPKTGVNAKWMIWKGFRIDSVIGASVLYTKYTRLANDETIVLESLVKNTSVKQDVSAIRPTVDMGLGLGFASYAMNNRLFFDASIRYDFAQYWSQGMSRNYASQLTGRDEVIGDLAMQGLTVNLRCDF